MTITSLEESHISFQFYQIYGQFSHMELFIYFSYNNIIMEEESQNKQQRQSILPTFSMDQLSESLIPRLQPIISLLNQPVIEMKALKVLMSEGITDEAHLIRQYVWKLVLGYLPKERSRWKSQIKKQQDTYNKFIEQFINSQKYPDYPLYITKKDKLWPQYEKDFYMWQQIEKDTCRTQAELSFFSTVVQPILIPFYTNTRRQKLKLIRGTQQKNCVFSKEQQRATYRYDYMTRILYIFAKLNPKVEYVQGMNEILAPIFYLVNCAHSSKSPIQEAACFFMFNNVMSDILELHMRDFGKKENGVHSRMRNISTMLLALQPKLWQHLQILKIDPFYYCFRWITLLFSQEFQMFETLRIWQAIFSYEDRTLYINFFALALILASKERILNSEYGEILSYLKNISQHIGIEFAIKHADELYLRYHKKDMADLAEKNRRKLVQREASSKNRFINFFKQLL